MTCWLLLRSFVVITEHLEIAGSGGVQLQAQAQRLNLGDSVTRLRWPIEAMGVAT